MAALRRRGDQRVRERARQSGGLRQDASAILLRRGLVHGGGGGGGVEIASFALVGARRDRRAGVRGPVRDDDQVLQTPVAVQRPARLEPVAAQVQVVGEVQRLGGRAEPAVKHELAKRVETLRVPGLVAQRVQAPTDLRLVVARVPKTLGFFERVFLLALLFLLLFLFLFLFLLLFLLLRLVRGHRARQALGGVASFRHRVGHHERDAFAEDVQTFPRRALASFAAETRSARGERFAVRVLAPDVRRPLLLQKTALHVLRAHAVHHQPREHVAKAAALPRCSRRASRQLARALGHAAPLARRRRALHQLLHLGRHEKREPLPPADLAHAPGALRVVAQSHVLPQRHGGARRGRLPDVHAGGVHLVVKREPAARVQRGDARQRHGVVLGPLRVSSSVSLGNGTVPRRARGSARGSA